MKELGYFFEYTLKNGMPGPISFGEESPWPMYTWALGRELSSRGCRVKMPNENTLEFYSQKGDKLLVSVMNEKIVVPVKYNKLLQEFETGVIVETTGENFIAESDKVCNSYGQAYYQIFNICGAIKKTLGDNTPDIWLDLYRRFDVMAKENEHDDKIDGMSSNDRKESVKLCDFPSEKTIILEGDLFSEHNLTSSLL